MSEFNLGDFIYCSDSWYLMEQELKPNIKYQINGIFGNWMNIIDTETGRTFRYKKERFIPEREYIINQRKEKLIKIKDGIQSRRQNILY